MKPTIGRGFWRLVRDQQQGTHGHTKIGEIGGGPARREKRETWADFFSVPKPVSPRMDFQLDVRVGGKYRLVRKIGSGSFGDIYSGTKA